MVNLFRRLVAGMVIVCLGSLSFAVPAQAGIVSSQALVAGTQQERLAALLERSDVRARLQAYGVSPQQAQERVAALSDEEAAKLAAQLDELPAGGTDVLVVALLVFLVLLFTDIMGYTKIFPFTRSMR